VLFCRSDFFDDVGWTCKMHGQE